MIFKLTFPFMTLRTIPNSNSQPGLIGGESFLESYPGRTAGKWECSLRAWDHASHLHVGPYSCYAYPRETTLKFLCKLLLKHLCRESLGILEAIPSIKKTPWPGKKFQLFGIFDMLSGQLTPETRGLDAGLVTFALPFQIIIPANPGRHI